jgi:hypothetical protein
LALRSNATNFVQVFIYLVCVPQSGIPGSHGNS